MDVVASWPVRVVAVVTMRATRSREALAILEGLTDWDSSSYCAAALAEIEALEAVAEAAQALDDFGCAGGFGPFTPGPGAEVVVGGLVAALARLAETQNGQTPGGGERVETAADNASLTPAGGEPVPAPGVCPSCGEEPFDGSQGAGALDVKWFLFPEGTSWQCLDEGTLDLGLVRDSVLNADLPCCGDPGDCGEDCA